jgi:hypothetical protein
LSKSDSANCSIIKDNLIIVFGLYEIAFTGNKWWATLGHPGMASPPAITCKHNLIKAKDNNQIIFDNGTIARIRFGQ